MQTWFSSMRSVIDLATYDDPRRPAAGFEAVWVNGVETLKGGKRTSNIPGRSIRSRKI